MVGRLAAANRLAVDCSDDQSMLFAHEAFYRAFCIQAEVPANVDWGANSA